LASDGARLVGGDVDDIGDEKQTLTKGEEGIDDPFLKEIACCCRCCCCDGDLIRGLEAHTPALAGDIDVNLLASKGEPAADDHSPSSLQLPLLLLLLNPGVLNRVAVNLDAASSLRWFIGDEFNGCDGSGGEESEEETDAPFEVTG
jgi:hypothetical protein